MPPGSPETCSAPEPCARAASFSTARSFVCSSDPDTNIDNSAPCTVIYDEPKPTTGIRSPPAGSVSRPWRDMNSPGGVLQELGTRSGLCPDLPGRRHVVPLGAAEDDLHGRAAILVVEGDRRPLHVDQPAVAPPQQGDQRRVKIDALLRQAVLIALPLPRLAVRHPVQQALVDQPGQPVAE